MEDDARSSSRADRDVKTEDAGADVDMADSKPKYKSWKKKYRKMRVKFDESMAEGEELYRLEQKALRKAKQLAVFNDRLLAMLLDINNSHQIPIDKRIDLRLDAPASALAGSDTDDVLALDIDTRPPDGPEPAKSLGQLLREVPHLDYAATAERFPDRATDLNRPVTSPAAVPALQRYPPNFLTADDVDNYLYGVDAGIAARHNRAAESADEEAPLETLPTLAPLARENGVAGGGGGTANGTSGAGGRDTPVSAAAAGASSNRDFLLRNPTSVYNWLRKNAPKVFLQDEENAGSERKGRGHAKDKDDGDDEHHPHPRGGRARKSTGGDKASSRNGAASAARSSKRASAAHARDKRKSVDESAEYPDDDLSYYDGAGTPSGGNGASAKAAAAAGKRKRQVDDDSGYRPKGGSNRPAKKKRKSLGGGGDGDVAGTPTPTTKRARKSGGAAAAAAAAAAATPAEVEGMEE